MRVSWDPARRRGASARLWALAPAAAPRRRHTDDGPWPAALLARRCPSVGGWEGGRGAYGVLRAKKKRFSDLQSPRHITFWMPAWPFPGHEGIGLWVKAQVTHTLLRWRRVAVPDPFG